MNRPTAHTDRLRAEQVDAGRRQSPPEGNTVAGADEPRRAEDGVDPDGAGLDAQPAPSTPRALRTREKIDSLFDMLRLPPELAALVTRDAGLPTRLGRYAIVKRLGQGGFGSVYLGYDARLERPVAIKVPASRRANLLADARKAASLRHDGIVTVHTIEEEPDGSFMIVMEYMEGGSLADRIEGQGQAAAARLPVENAIQIVADVADAVHYAHEHGIIHRDLKPDNILFDLEGRPHVADFGLAVYASQRTERNGNICGTAQYMAPEQIRGETDRIDRRTDVWSLGVVLFELLTGQPPFSGASRQQLFDCILHGDCMPVRQVNGKVPDTRAGADGARIPNVQVPCAGGTIGETNRLEEVVRKCLKKDRSDRYGSSAELAGALRECLTSPGAQTRPLSKPDHRWQHAARPIAAVAIFVGALVMILAGIGRRERPRGQAEQTATHLDSDASRIEWRAKTFDYARSIQGAYRAWKNADVRAAIDLLSQSVPRAGDEDLRGFEWYYLRRLCEGGVKTLRGHQGRAYGAAFSHDGKRLASCGEDGTVRIWESATGRSVHVIQADAGPIYAVTFSENGEWLAAGGEDGKVRMWGARTYAPITTLEGHTDGVTCLAFSPGSRTLAAGSEDTTIRLFDVATGHGIGCCRGHGKTVHCIAFSPDGERLYSASEDRSVRAWDPKSTGRPLAVWRGVGGNDLGRVFSLALAPTGRILAFTSETVIFFVDLTEHTHTALPLEHRNTVRAALFSHDGALFASAGDDQRVLLWNANTRQVRHVYRGHTDRVYHLAFSPVGDLLASASKDGTVRIWDTGADQDRERLLMNVGDRVHAITFSPRGDTIAAVFDGQQASGAAYSSIASPNKGTVFACPVDRPFSALAYYPDGDHLALATLSGQVMRWDTANSKKVQTLDDAAGEPLCIAVAAGGHGIAVAGSEQRSARIIDADSGKILASLPGQRCLAFSPDHRLMAFESAIAQFAVELWDIRAERSVGRFTGHTGYVYKVAFSPDGHYLASASDDGTARLWDVLTTRAVHTLRAHAGPVRDVVFHPGGRRVATAGAEDGKVILWDIETGVQLLSLDVSPEGSVDTIAFSPDGRILATGSTDGKEGHIDLWHAAGHDATW